MKKVYLAPQTKAIQMLGENAIMAVSTQFINGFGTDIGSGYTPV